MSDPACEKPDENVTFVVLSHQVPRSNPGSVCPVPGDLPAGCPSAFESFGTETGSFGKGDAFGPCYPKSRPSHRSQMGSRVMDWLQGVGDFIVILTRIHRSCGRRVVLIRSDFLYHKDDFTAQNGWTGGATLLDRLARLLLQ